MPGPWMPWAGGENPLPPDVMVEYQYSTCPPGSECVHNDTARGVRWAGQHPVVLFRLMHADADGWIQWDGGDCPVPSVIVVQTTLRNGGINPAPGHAAGIYRWDHRGNSADIIAYRFAGLPEPESAYPVPRGWEAAQEATQTVSTVPIGFESQIIMLDEFGPAATPQPVGDALEQQGWIRWGRPHMPDDVDEHAYIDLINSAGHEYHHYEARGEFIGVGDGAGEGYVAYYRCTVAPCARTGTVAHHDLLTIQAGLHAPMDHLVPEPPAEPVERVFDCPVSGGTCMNAGCTLMYCERHHQKVAETKPRAAPLRLPKGRFQKHERHSLIIFKPEEGSGCIMADIGYNSSSVNASPSLRQAFLRRVHALHEMEAIIRSISDERAAAILARLDAPADE